MADAAAAAMEGASLAEDDPSAPLPYELYETLGEGSTGKVRRGVHRVTGQVSAVKCISKEIFASRPELLVKVERECDILKTFDHPHVLGYLGRYEDEKCLYICLSHYEGGELFDYLQERGRLTMAEARRFFQQIISALSYCHERNVCHRDLKPENILLNLKREVKVADFGYAQYMIPGDFLETSCGSPHYASPEIVSGAKYVGNQADIWSAGVVLYALLTGGLPFDDENIQRLLLQVKRGTFTFPDCVCEPAKNLISGMLTVDPDKRLTIAQINAHAWMLADASSGGLA